MSDVKIGFIELIMNIITSSLDKDEDYDYNNQFDILMDKSLSQLIKIHKELCLQKMK